MIDEKQLGLNERELERLKDRIYQDFLAARSNHDRRIARFRRYYRMWRGLVERGTKEDGAGFEVPMLKWFTFGHWARCMQALLGDDAEIVAVPTAPTDERDARMAGRYMTWRVFEYMRAVNPLTVWVFRCILFGTAHAELNYEQEYFWERNPKTGEDTESLCYDGPRLTPLWPSQIVLPAQDEVRSIDDFEWIIRRRRVTPQQLLDGERRGRFQAVTDNWEQIVAFSQERQERDYWWDDERIDADAAEGVDHASVLGNRDSLDLWEWYGKWRLPKGNQDATPYNLKRRQPLQAELLVKYIPHAQLIVGVQDLRDLYPRIRKRRPFVDLHLVKDGSYWGPGLGEMLEMLEEAASRNHNLFERGGTFSVGPIIFYRPSAGFDPETFEYKPNTAVPTEDPAGVNVVRMQGNLEYPIQMAGVLKSIAELISGVSDQTLGQAIDRPNAPRTASGQAMLIQEGNVRASLDMTMLREDLNAAMGYCWELDREYADEQVFFRVTESDRPGFDIDRGFGVMTSEQREHEFGFDVKFATSIWAREAKKQAIVALYQISLQNPLVAQNPRALWVLLNRVWEAFGERNFRDVLPEPPDLDQPRQPKAEWQMALQGDDLELHVNPLDDDRAHVLDHQRRLMAEKQEPEERRDNCAIAIMEQHIHEHMMQMEQKRVLQVAVGQAVEQMRAQQSAQAMPYPAQVPLARAQTQAKPGAAVLLAPANSPTPDAVNPAQRVV
ncbi:MAG TPA: hypothetical protein VKU01_23355 [Bryobacteraceae bacterium]|nr:hypothetical protein [Bryobacteraceae bacterium]